MVHFIKITVLTVENYLQNVVPLWVIWIAWKFLLKVRTQCHSVLSDTHTTGDYTWLSVFHIDIPVIIFMYIQETAQKGMW